MARKKYTQRERQEEAERLAQILKDSGYEKEGSVVEERFLRPDFCEYNYKPPYSSDASTPNYWIVLKDYTYNTKDDRYVCALDGEVAVKEDVVANTNLKIGERLNRNFRYENAVQTMVADGVIMEASKYDAEGVSAKKGINYKGWLIYALLVGAGYFAYKKFKK